MVREPNNMFIVYFSGRPVTVYPAGPIRWGRMVRWADDRVDVYAWDMVDMREVIQAHTAAHPDHQETGVSMYISSASDYYFLRGNAGELASWSEDAWTSLLQAVPTTWRSDWLCITVPSTAPLRGLLACRPHLTQDRNIMVVHGKAGLGEVEACVYTCQQAGLRVQLYSTTILVPQGEEYSLRARRNRLCEAKDRWGGRMVNEPEWRTQTRRRNIEEL